MIQLPTIATEAELDALVADGPAVARILGALLDELGVDGPFDRPARGSALVARTATEVVKLMAPLDAELSQAEARCLAALEGQLPIPTPRLIDAGELQGWRWIRMTRLEGEELAEAWPSLSAAERLDLGTQLGEALAVLHALEAPPEVQRLDWDAWCAERLPSLEARQRARGAPDALLDGLEAFVRGADLAEGRRAWLHTEVMREHLLVTRDTTRCRLSGLFDFEPSWVGPQHYEYASVGLFVSAGDPAVLGAVLRAADVDLEPRRLFALAMLHRYANLGWYHRRLGGPDSLEGLAEAWFGSR